MKKMYEILVTNDDGYESKGLGLLVEALRGMADVHVTVVAPANEKSACGHSLTLTKPLRFVSVDDDFYKLEDGTPSDCIYLSLNAIYGVGNKPDLVVSGINKGSNMGEDITYSGTCSAAMEAILHDIPALAISQVVDFSQIDIDYTLALKTAVELVEKIRANEFPLPKREFLNINIPNKPKAAKKQTTYAGYRHYCNDAQLHQNPRGEEYYWLGLHPLSFQRRQKAGKLISDFEAIEAGDISITPVMVDMSSYDSIQKVAQWL